MSRSESAFKDVAEALRRIRPRVLTGDAPTVDDAIDLLISAHNFLEEDDYDGGEIDDQDGEARAVPIGNPPAYMQLFCLGEILLLAVSVEPLTEEHHGELVHRCSFPLDFRGRGWWASKNTWLLLLWLSARRLNSGELRTIPSL